MEGLMRDQIKFGHTRKLECKVVKHVIYNEDEQFHPGDMMDCGGYFQRPNIIKIWPDQDDNCFLHTLFHELNHYVCYKQQTKIWMDIYKAKNRHHYRAGNQEEAVDGMAYIWIVVANNPKIEELIRIVADDGPWFLENKIITKQ